MTNTAEFIQAIEKKLTQDGNLKSSDFCNDFHQLPQRDQKIYATVFLFLGCDHIELDQSEIEIDDSSHLQICKLLLLSTYIATGIPSWSSTMLDKIWECAIKVYKGNLSNVYRSLFSIFYENNIELTDIIVNFIRAITYNGQLPFILSYKKLYIEDDFDWLNYIIDYDISTAQAYLLLYSCSYHHMKPKMSIKIIIELSKTNFLLEALGFLYDSLTSEDGRKLLESLNNHELDKATQLKIRNFLDIDSGFDDNR